MIKNFVDKESCEIDIFCFTIRGCDCGSRVKSVY